MTLPFQIFEKVSHVLNIIICFKYKHIIISKQMTIFGKWLTLLKIWNGKVIGNVFFKKLSYYLFKLDNLKK